MIARLLLLFVLVPIVELAILVQLGRVVGLWPTLALVVVTGVTGAALARAEGLRALVAFRAELARGAVPGRALLDGLSILVGGAFLLTPGLLTDVVGFSLLLPPSRRWIQGRLRRWLEREIRSGRLQVGFVGSEGWIFRAGGGAGGSRREERLDPRHEIRPERRGED